MSVVQVSLNESTTPCGTLFTHERRARITSTFTYASGYLGKPQAYSLDPELSLVAGTQPVSAHLPRAFSDAAPDRWGRTLIARQHRADGATRAFDVNPNPNLSTPRATSIGGEGEPMGEIAAVLRHCRVFGLTRSAASDVITRVVTAVSQWHDVARRHGIPAKQMALFAPVFDHVVTVGALQPERA